MNSAASITGRHAALSGTEDISLRPAADADLDFLRAVFTSTRAAEFAHSGWEPADLDALLAEQFALQDTYYRRHYPHAHFDLVICGATDVGRLYHDWSAVEVRLIDIALAPPYRSLGIGTRLMHALVAEAAQQGLAASLYVEMDNPVRALYHRLGFLKVGEHGIYECMRREAGPFHGAAGPGRENDGQRERRLFQSASRLP